MLASAVVFSRHFIDMNLYDVVFLPSSFLLAALGFPLAPCQFKLLVHGLTKIFVCKSALRWFGFMKLLVVSGFLISCGSDALGVLGLRPGSGILCWGFCGLVVFDGCGWHVQVL